MLLLENKYPTFSMMPSFVVRRLWVDLFGLPGRPMTVKDLLHVSPNPIDPYNCCCQHPQDNNDDTIVTSIVMHDNDDNDDDERRPATGG